jgi:hypothetical protein
MQYNNQYVQPPPSGYNYNQPHAPAGYGWSGGSILYKDVAV